MSGNVLARQAKPSSAFVQTGGSERFIGAFDNSQGNLEPDGAVSRHVKDIETPACNLTIPMWLTRQWRTDGLTGSRLQHFHHAERP